MKYKEQQQLVEDLHTLAEFYARPESIVLPAMTLYETFFVSRWDWDNDDRKYALNPIKSKALLKRIVKVLGDCTKDWGDSDLRVVKTMGHNIKLVYNVSREAICKKVPTGNKIHHTASYHSTPAYVEDEVEWVCDDVSLLA